MVYSVDKPNQWWLNMRIKVVDICRSFGKTQALDNVSFEVPEGTIFGFVGPNGAGKSTAMRIMAARELPDSGQVLYDDVNAIDYPEKVREFVGYMPDSLPEKADIKVWEYLDFFARAFGLTGEKRLKRLSELEEMAQLTDLRDKLLKDLSKGMKQRVTLARMLINDPPVLLLDEPTAGLDPRARIEMRHLLTKLHSQRKTILISSHIISELNDLCDGVVIIEKGLIVKSGKLQDFAGENTENIVILKFKVPVSEIMDELKSIPEVISLETQSTNMVTVKVGNTDENIQQMMIEIFRKGLPLTMYERNEHRLEDIFMQSTKGEVQ